MHQKLKFCICKTTTKFLFYWFDNQALMKNQHRQLKALKEFLKVHFWNLSGTVICTGLVGNGESQ